MLIKLLAARVCLRVKAPLTVRSFSRTNSSGPSLRDQSTAQRCQIFLGTSVPVDSQLARWRFAVLVPVSNLLRSFADGRVVKKFWMPPGAARPNTGTSGPCITMVSLTLSVSRIPSCVKPLRNIGVGNPRKLSRSSPAAAAAGEALLMAASSAKTSMPSPSSREKSTSVKSLEKGALRNSSSTAPMPVASN